LKLLEVRVSENAGRAGVACQLAKNQLHVVNISPPTILADCRAGRLLLSGVERQLRQSGFAAGFHDELDKGITGAVAVGRANQVNGSSGQGRVDVLPIAVWIGKQAAFDWHEFCGRTPQLIECDVESCHLQGVRQDEAVVADPNLGNLPHPILDTGRSLGFRDGPGRVAYVRCLGAGPRTEQSESLGSARRADHWSGERAGLGKMLGDDSAERIHG